ncbi:hypothetical protein JZ751_026823 [Albula glossodonta]|uniref:Uncharacterized protein n=1 Tax=Albula glossodonta TaxID=121402 RepID=A0A8T2PEF3_9TELE|nr:hypothetical protein JZ751_026823 [Albula glossodonta]
MALRLTPLTQRDYILSLWLSLILGQGGLALKRSFEVEDVDTSTHPSPHARRTPNLRTPVSSPSQRFQEAGARNSDLSPKPSTDGANQRSSPKPNLRRVELPGGRTPEPVSRRTEICIDITSKQQTTVDSSPSPGISRFGLKRPEVLGHSKTPEQAHKRVEVSLSRSQETLPTQARSPAAPPSRIPEPIHRKGEPPCPGEAPSRRPEINVTKAPAEVPAPAKSPPPPTITTTKPITKYMSLPQTSVPGVPTVSLLVRPLHLPPTVGHGLGDNSGASLGKNELSMWVFIVHGPLSFVVILHEKPQRPNER